MGAIDPRLTSNTSPSARERFWLARRAMAFALLDWVRERPDYAEVVLEIDGTIAAVRQLARSLQAGGQP